MKRVPCKEDRRVIYAEITEEGNAWFDRIFPKHAAVIDSFMKLCRPMKSKPRSNCSRSWEKGRRMARRVAR